MIAYRSSARAIVLARLQRLEQMLRTVQTETQRLQLLRHQVKTLKQEQEPNDNDSAI